MYNGSDRTMDIATDDHLKLTTNRRFEVGVKNLVDLICRKGDLVLDMAEGPSAEEGLRVHKKLQKARQTIAETEVSIEFVMQQTIDDQPIELKVKGRADVVYFDTLPPVLEEIKSTYCIPEALSGWVKDLHWSQAKIYAFGLCQEHGWEAMSVKLLYYDINAKTEHLLEKIFTFDELKKFANETILAYLTWMVKVEDAKVRARQGASTLHFPYGEFRPGQREFSKQVYRAIREGKNLMAQAPTGIGKTMSALFPAVKALGDSLIDKVLYLTAKQTGRGIALDSAQSIVSSGCPITVLELKAKAKACVCANGTLCLEDAQICPNTEGFFDRLPEARNKLMDLGKMDAATVAKVADEYTLCAFELALQMLPWVDVVVCDYNYVYDPLVRLSYFDETRDRICALVDEVHNLVDRSRGMYSGQLSVSNTKQQLSVLRKRGDYGKPYLSAARKVKSALDRVLKESQNISEPTLSSLETDSIVLNGPPETLRRACEKLINTVMTLSSKGHPPPGVMKEWLKDVYRYSAIDQRFSANHRSLLHRPLKKSGLESEVELYCLDASTALDELHQTLHSSIVFSATVSPVAYYQKSLGYPDDTQTLDLPSPFSVENLRVVVAEHIDTRWRFRQQAIPKICDLISMVVRQKPGKYLVFFSSYQFMSQVYEAYVKGFSSASSLMVQQKGASEEERADFLESFEKNQAVSLGFVIIGGIFAEGIDYVGDRLIGAIIIGPGLPQPDLKTRLLTEKFEGMYQAGFDYAYRYPANTRVLQSAGRVIRSESDKGVVILADRRFSTPDYLSLFPPHWQPWIVSNQDQLQANLQRFWGDMEIKSSS